MKQKFRDAYMKTAEVFAELSSARRLHVGAIVVKDDRIISIGYNGMPSGWDNNCEDDVYRIIPNLNTELDLSEAQPISLFELKSACRELVAVLDRNDIVASIRALFTPPTPPADDNSESQAS